MNSRTDNPLWHYSLAVYQRPGVEPLLLRLQDEYGTDVNVLLACCWLAERGQRLTAEALVCALEKTEPWRRQCVMPLRAVRRYLKHCEQTDELRRQVKALELGVEQYQQQLLFEVWNAFPEARQDENFSAAALHNLRHYCLQHCGGTLSGAGREQLISLLAGLVQILEGK